MVVKFTFQSVFGNSLQNPRHFSARGREESLELYSILWSDWPTSKQKVLRHGNRFAARVGRRYFSEGKKGRPEMRLLFAGYAPPHPPPPKKKKLPQWLIKGHLIPYPAFWLRHWITLSNLIHKINSCKQCKNNYFLYCLGKNDTKGISLISSGRFVSYLRVKVLLSGIQRFKFQLNILNSVQRE